MIMESCKYCFESEGTLIKPCNCVQKVHKECLDTWRKLNIGTKTFYVCEICHCIFKIKFIRLFYPINFFIIGVFGTETTIFLMYPTKYCATMLFIFYLFNWLYQCIRLKKMNIMSHAILVYTYICLSAFNFTPIADFIIGGLLLLTSNVLSSCYFASSTMHYILY